MRGKLLTSKSDSLLMGANPQVLKGESPPPSRGTSETAGKTAASVSVQRQGVQ